MAMEVSNVKRIFLILTAVLMLCLAACGGVSEDETPPSEREDKYDLIPMVMVDGELYYDTGRESRIKDRRCGTMDGEITSTVESWEVPQENCQSNFGTGYGYQYGAEDTIELAMNDKWIVFERPAGDGGGIFPDSEPDRSIKKDEPSWIDWYNGIKKEDQNAAVNVPANFAKLMGRGAGTAK